MSSKYVNLGCGSVFVDSPAWVNLDFSPSSPGVQGANLLSRLPLQDESAAVVYASHFLEHVPRSSVPAFLRECCRVLEPSGVIRLVLPDLENMAREYLRMRELGEHDKANFLVMEMIDQCVRQEPGGELGRYFQSLGARTDKDTEQMMDYVRERVGEEFRALSGTENATKVLLRKLRRVPTALPSRIAHYWIRLCLLALPAAFRAQNVCFAAVGERHHWLWDFHQLRGALEAAGFTQVQRQSAKRSAIDNFPFHPLDLDADGRPRKGAESMYVEASKPD